MIKPSGIEIKSSVSRQASGGGDTNIILLDARSMKNEEIRWFNTNNSCLDSTSLLKNSIINGSALSVSDRSYYPVEEAGVCVWKPATPN